MFPLILFVIIALTIVYILLGQKSTDDSTTMAADWDAFVKRSLSKYRHRDRTKKDALLVLKEYKGLRPKVDFYNVGTKYTFPMYMWKFTAFNDDTKKELFSIAGTIPISFKGNTYNIPICIWIMDTHPDIAPLCFVTPTPDMLIKPSIHVDSNGRVYLPYIQDWKYPSSDLLGLIQVLTAVFSANTPLYAKSVGTNPSYSPLPTKRPAPIPPSPTNLTVPKYMEDECANEVMKLQDELRLLKQRLKTMELETENHQYTEKTKLQKSQEEPSPEICKICMARRRNTVFLCGHSACKDCGESLINCIKCKQRITKRILLKD